MAGFPLIDRISAHLPPRASAAVVAIGGGSLLNVAGFLASVVARGVEFVAVPTTPMAMCDVAFGSKHGLNTTVFKNYVGTYYDPKLILINSRSLSTLEVDSLKRSSIEALKQALLTSRDQWEVISSYYYKPVIDPAEYFSHVLYPAAVQKMEILNSDPHELSIGKVLMFGHHIGHALEVAADFAVTHDRAVADGMYVELCYLTELGLFPAVDLLEFKETLYHAGIEFNISYNYDVFGRAMRDCKLADPRGFTTVLAVRGIGSIGPEPELLPWSVEDAIVRAQKWLSNG
jgi:3-dehydroquinate synthetase